VAGSTNGLFGSRFATGLQIHNPTDAQLGATLVFHRAGESGPDSDPRLDVTVAPRATFAIDELVARMGVPGVGSLDLSTTAALRPITVARVYSIGANGQTSLTTDLVAEEDALRAGENGVLVAPNRGAALNASA
jgi:hypothetical protein